VLWGGEADAFRQRGSVSRFFQPPQFSRERGRAAVQPRGNAANACAIAWLELEQDAPLQAQMTVLYSHASTLRDSGVLHLAVESKKPHWFYWA